MKFASLVCGCLRAIMTCGRNTPDRGRVGPAPFDLRKLPFVAARQNSSANENCREAEPGHDFQSSSHLPGCHGPAHGRSGMWVGAAERAGLDRGNERGV